MDNLHDDLDKLTNEWVGEAGLEKPSSTFVRNVMDAIEAKSAQEKVYKPLISQTVWGWVAALFVGSLVVFYFLPQGENSILGSLNITALPDVKMPFSGIELSKTMVYAIGFLALFLVQIPFLKRRYIN